MSLIGNFLDRLSDRVIDRLLDRGQRRMLHPNALLLQEAQRDAADYVKQHMQGTLALGRREDSLRIAYGRAPADGMVLEFGVGGGDSTRLLADHAAADGRVVHGFDSFEGLPEDWAGRHEEKGHYSLGGQLPTVPGNVTLHKGLFAETLPGFLSNQDGPCAFLHIDCDLYSSATVVLDVLAPRIQPGTIILFDEYFNYPSWRDNEHKAFREFVAAHNVTYDYLLWGHQEVAVAIRDMA